jgi:hypothetical protein
VRTDIGSRTQYISFDLSISIMLILISGMQSCMRCTTFCKKILSDSGMCVIVCSGMLRRITLAIACPSVSFAVMQACTASFKQKCCSVIFVIFPEHSLYELGLTCHATCQGSECEICVTGRSHIAVRSRCRHVRSTVALYCARDLGRARNQQKMDGVRQDDAWDFLF